MLNVYEKYLKEKQSKKGTKFISLSPDWFTPDPDQPRRKFDDTRMLELQRSMELEGQLQPILVLPPEKAGRKYTIIAGERRWRAACVSEKILSLDAIVRCPKEHAELKISINKMLDGLDSSDRIVTLISQISENTKRENLTVLDEAQSYQKVVEELGGSLNQAIKLLGLSKSLLSKYLAFSRADEKVQSLSEKGLCQDIATLYTINNLLKVDRSKAEEIIDNWQGLADAGANMRRLTEDSVREAKQARREASITAEPIVSEVSINKETFIYLLKIKQGKNKQCFTLPAKQFQLLRNQVMQFDIV